MINTAGAYILVLIFSSFNQGGVAMQEFSNFESCKAAIAQIKTIREPLWGYCIAKDVQK